MKQFGQDERHSCKQNWYLNNFLGQILKTFSSTSSSRQTVLCTAIQKGTVEDWDFLWSRYLLTDNANEKNTFLGGLACSQEDWILERFLGMALDESSGIGSAQTSWVGIRQLPQ